MILKKLSKNDLKSRLIKLMDDVKIHLIKEPDVDKFLDETNLFDDWELALPQHEYPILVMAVLNDIRKDNILNSLVDSVFEETNVGVICTTYTSDYPVMNNAHLYIASKT